MRFSKVLAKYYRKWYQDCIDSVQYCLEHGDTSRAMEYAFHAERYIQIIAENWEAIEFFSEGKNAFIIDRALPVEFRGYN